MYNNNLYTARKECGKTQAELAQALDMNVTVYSRYERGDRDIPLSVAARISELLDVSIDYIACRSKHKLGIGYDKDSKRVEDTVVNPLLVNSDNPQEGAREVARRIENQIRLAVNDLNQFKAYYNIDTEEKP